MPYDDPMPYNHSMSHNDTMPHYHAMPHDHTMPYYYPLPHPHAMPHYYSRSQPLHDCGNSTLVRCKGRDSDREGSGGIPGGFLDACMGHAAPGCVRHAELLHACRSCQHCVQEEQEDHTSAPSSAACGGPRGSTAAA